MDGGDILRLGDIFFVGRSDRTNEAGIETSVTSSRISVTSCESVDIPTEKALHLTSISSTPTDNIILTAEGYLTPEDLENFQKAVRFYSCLKKKSTGATRLVSKTEKSWLQKAIQPFFPRSRRKGWIQSFSTWVRFARLMVQSLAVQSSSEFNQRVDIRECGRSNCCRGRPAWSKALG